MKHLKTLFASAITLLLCITTACASASSIDIDVYQNYKNKPSVYKCTLTIQSVDSEGNPLDFDTTAGPVHPLAVGSTCYLPSFHNTFAHEGYTLGHIYLKSGSKKLEITDLYYSSNGYWCIRTPEHYSRLRLSNEIDLPDTGDLTVYFEYLKIVSSTTSNPVHTSIRMRLYDYGSYIDVGYDKDLLFGHCTRIFEGIDGQPKYGNPKNWYHYAMPGAHLLNGGIPKLEKTLINGVPQATNGRSYAYLFPTDGPALNTGLAENPLSSYDKLREETTFDPEWGYVSPFESMRFDLVGDGGLFYEDEEGYYVYDSGDLSAYFNQDTGKFELSPIMVSPSHNGLSALESNYYHAMNFTPFDKLYTDNLIDAPAMPSKQIYMQPFSKTEDLRETIPNFFFGMYIEFEFYMPKDGKINGEDMVFHFGGDDDVWCFVDDVCVLDIGGTHAPIYGSINFSTGKVSDPNRGGTFSSNDRTLKETFEEAGVSTRLFDGDTFADYTKHTLKFFYLERGGNIGYCHLRFNVPLLPDKSLTVHKTLEPHQNSDVTALIRNGLSYDFRVLQADENGNATNKLFIKPGTTYTILKNGKETGTGTVGPDGVFSLKADEAAQFHDMWLLAEQTGADSYIVEERLPDELTGSYGAVEYIVDGSTNTITGESGSSTDFTAFRSSAMHANETQLVTYRNKVRSTVPLNITKLESGDSHFLRQETYSIEVLVGNQNDPASALDPIDAGSVYTVGSKQRTVTEKGVIELSAGETAQLRLLSGTQFMVRELPPQEGIYFKASYTLDGQDARNYALGTIAPAQSTASSVVVTNFYYDPAYPDGLPDTGDRSAPILYTVLALLSAGAVMLLYRRRA